MRDILLAVVTGLGGLGVFVLGLKHLSEGLQAVAGQGLRRLVGNPSSNRLSGVGVGLLSTLIVQSSAITVAMMAGVASSGMMTLAQTMDVIIGASIGTTGTVWLVAFAPSPEMMGMLGLGVGGMLYFFTRRESTHNLGLAVLGFGLVLLGFYFMAKGAFMLKGCASVAGAFPVLSVQSFVDVAIVVVLAVAVSAAFNSAATIAMAMAMAIHGLIPYEAAVATVFGANIGTTVAVWKVAYGDSASARRTALAHTLMNVAGSLVALPFIFPAIVPFSKWLFPGWETVTETAKGPILIGMLAPIAVVDTLFAVARGLLAFPFNAPLAALLTRIIPESDGDKPHLSAIGKGVKMSPVIACDQALLEIQFMRDSNIRLLTFARGVVAGESDDAMERHIVSHEAMLDNVQREVTEFLGSVMMKRLPQDVAERSRRLLRLTDELESVSDEAAQVLKVVKRLRKIDQKISEVSAELLLQVHDRVFAFAEKISPWIRSPRPQIDVETIQQESREIHEFIRDCRRTQLGRVGPHDPNSPLRVLGELDIINAYERVRAYYLNIAEALAGGKSAQKETA